MVGKCPIAFEDLGPHQRCKHPQACAQPNTPSIRAGGRSSKHTRSAARTAPCPDPRVAGMLNPPGPPGRNRLPVCHRGSRGAAVTDASGLAALLFLTAVLYTAAGQAGASGYLAVMAVYGLAPDDMRPAALVLNLVASAVTAARFRSAGHFDRG